MIRTGELRNRITIQKKEDETWNDFVTVWASKDPILGKEYFAAEQAQSEVEFKFRCRYIAGVANDEREYEMRIVHGEKKYKILSAINVKSLNWELLMYCKKVR